MNTIEEYLDMQKQNRKFSRDLKYAASTGAFCVGIAVGIEQAQAFGVVGCGLFVAAVVNAIALEQGISDMDKVALNLVSQLNSDIQLGKHYDIC